ncbi:MAG: saccharopine dehydrogenase C-terminal domain-containing protein [Bacteroidales bacterium]
MKSILVLGAGLSSSSLIKYLLDNSNEYNWQVILGDISKDLAEKKINNHPKGKSVKFDVFDERQRGELIEQADLVISMLPARMHSWVAMDCVEKGTHMLTASYVSEDIKELDEKAKEKGVLLLNEMGVDPGIDHMSAMQVVDKIKEKGGELKAFESSTGGLVAPEYDDNPWGYKFTWNPRNVVVAGQGVSQFLHNGKIKYIPYHKLFTRTEKITIDEVGDFEIYPNRDSLKYIDIYGLENLETMFRGTMRRPGYAEAWNVFVQLGMTEDTYIVRDSESLTYREFIDSYLPYIQGMDVEQKLVKYLGIEEDGNIMHRLKWLGIFENTKIGLKNATPAQILQKIIEPKWKMKPEDKDMIVMIHLFDYELEKKRRRIKSTLVFTGRDKMHTAMSITVGVPVAIAAKLLLNGKISLTGVQRPLNKEIYEPVMEELAEYGIRFEEEEVVLDD